MRRTLPVTLFGAILCIVSAFPALAQPFPSKTVRIVVPYPAGGSVDVLARALAIGLAPLWSQPVVVENIAGASSIIGAARVATAPPDGHTLLFTIDATVVNNRFLFKKLPYDPDNSLMPITMLVQGGLFVIVHPSIPASNLRELVEAARRAPRKIAYGSIGMGGAQHLGFETIAKREGVQFLHVIYKGIGPITTAMLSGEVQLSAASSASAGGVLKAGKVKPLAIGGARRSNLFPDVPTLAESGYPYVAFKTWYGFFAPGGTAAQLRERIFRDLTSIAKRPEFIEKYINPIDLDLVVSTPAEFAAAIRADVAITAEMVKAADIKPD